MAMAVSQRKEGDVTIFEFSGPVTIGKGDVAVRESVHKALEAGERRILLDFDGVTALDSSGVGELISAYTSITNRGGELKLSRLSPKLHLSGGGSDRVLARYLKLSLRPDFRPQ
jgi:anti-sigma B factor antagonist